jgi:hypothetical protein
VSNAGVRAAGTTGAFGIVALAAAACAAAVPKEPPPTVPGVNSAPPPAWIETRAGDRWLAFFDYCWARTCADSRPIEQRRDIPRLRVARGELVRFHLRFRPSSLRVEHGRKTYVLPAQRVAAWRVRGGTGYLKVTARAKPGRAEYAARVVVR